MKQKNSITIFLASAFMLVVSFCAMWLALTVFGRLSDAPVESEQKFTFNNNLLGIKITQQDYDNYPSQSASVIPNYMENYILQPQDATVLAVKQIKNICGIDLKGYTANLALNTYDKCWEGSFSTDLVPDEGIQNFFYVDAVSGELYGFSDGRNNKDFSYSAEDFYECAKIALSAAEKQFPDKINSMQIQESQENYTEKSFLRVSIVIDVDRTVSYMFLKNNNDEFYICSFFSR